MLIGFALIIVAVFLCCALLFRLSIYALPLFVAFLAGSATYRSGIVAALAAAAIAATAVIALKNPQITGALITAFMGPKDPKA